MKLKKLIKDILDIETKGSLEVEISNIEIDSRKVFPGTLFIAKKGDKTDGSKYIYEAKNSGAIAVVTDVYDPFLNLAQILHKNPASLEADLACKFYDNPSKDLFSIAITGTSGKTTTSFLLKHIFEYSNTKCGVIGTLGHYTGKRVIKSELGTPQSLDLQKYLKEMVLNNTNVFCMEATSIGIDQNRIKNIDFDVAIFTNLTKEHLEYHKTFDSYKNAKKKLFSNLSKKAFSIINIDDPSHSEMVENSLSKVITFSCLKEANLQAKEIHYTINGSHFTLIYKNKSYLVQTNLIGQFNIYNILAAMAAGLIKKIPIENIIKAVSTFENVNGRLEKIKNERNIHLFVDYAHKEDALKNVLQTLTRVKKRRIITVFGCGGERDQTKRAKMAMISENLSDITIVTSDNPRSEDPIKIIDDIKKGFSDTYKYFVEPERRKAIEMALKLANIDDIVLIAGKGHETYQILKDKTIEFDDKKVCLELLKTQ